MEYLGMKHAHGKIIINTTDEKHGKFTGPVSSGMGWTVRF
jgi:hypothetical protein